MSKSSTWGSAKRAVEDKENPPRPIPKFEKIEEAAKRRGWLIGIWGPPAAGKTHFALSMPEPVYVIDTEMGAAQLKNQFKGKDIRIASVWEAGDDFETDPILCLENVDRIVDGLDGITPGSTIVIDSGTDLWTWIAGVLRLVILKVDKTASIQPSDWQWANSKYAAIILKILKHPVHLVITARDRTIYTSASLDTTGATEPHWQKWTPNYMDFTIELQKVKDDYYGVIEKCRYIRDKRRLKSEKDPTWDWLYETYKDVVPFKTFGEE